MAVDGRIALELLDAVGNANAKGEYYLTDIVEIARAKGRKVVATEVPFEEVLGINNRVELAEAEAIWQQHKRREMMLAGVTMIEPETVVFAYDTVIGQDTVLEPGVFFAPGVTIAAQRQDTRLFASRRRERRPERRSRPVRAAAARRRARRKVQGRQFLRGQEGQGRRRRQGQPPHLYRRCGDRREGQYRRRHHHLQL